MEGFEVNHTTYRWARLWGDSWRYVVEARNHEGTPIYRAIAVTDDFGRLVFVA